ncbi:MAG TPA: hypothetical protein VG602_02980, partial [Actinomycetota bacterium]|nr:hypothetical protein [Actinomycetota bacterium]
MRARRFVAALFVLASIGGLGAPSVNAATGPPPLTRWFGGEGGFIETACYGFAHGCPGFLAAGSFGGLVGTQPTHKRIQDLDLAQREWP